MGSGRDLDCEPAGMVSAGFGAPVPTGPIEREHDMPNIDCVEYRRPNGERVARSVAVSLEMADIAFEVQANGYEIGFEDLGWRWTPGGEEHAGFAVWIDNGPDSDEAFAFAVEPTLDDALAEALMAADVRARGGDRDFA